MNLRPSYLVLKWSCLAFTACLALEATAQTLTPKWTNSTFAATGYRGLAYNPATSNLLVAQTSGNIIRLNSWDGTSAGANLDVSTVSGGTFVLAGVTVLKDGPIFACNYVPGAQSTTPLNVYQWDNEAAVPTMVASLGTLPGAAADRFGEHMKVYRTATTTNFLIAGTASIGYLLIYDAGTWTFKQLTVDAQVMRPTGSFIDYDAPGFAGRVRMVAKSRGSNGQLYNFDPTAASPINLVANKVGMSGAWVFIANGITSHDYDPATGLIAGTTSTLQAAPFSYTNMIFITTNGVAAPIELSRVTVEATAADVGVNNATTWGADGRLFTMIPIGGAGLRAFDISAFVIKSPASLTKVAGQNATFSSLFGGSALTYQWKKGVTVLSDDSKYSGTTTPSLTISNLVGADADTYTITATDANGGTASASATLTLAPSQMWTGGGTDDNWSTAGNWGGTALAPSGEVAIFAGNVRTTPVMDASYDVSGLLFSATAGAFNLTNSGATTLTLSGSLGNESTNLQTLSLPIALNSPQSIDIAAPVNVSGTISGSAALTKLGNATLTLSGTNSHAGGLIINGGTVAVTSGSAIVDTNVVTLGNGGVLSVDAAETIGGLAGSASSVVLNQKLTLAGPGGTYTGGISGTNDLEIAVTGTQANNSSTVYSGTTILTAGTLSVNDASTLGDGTGILQLNGGTFFRATQSTAQNFPNPVVLTANSIIAANPTSGTRQLPFTSATLTHSNGTLIVTNSAASGTGLFSFRINGTSANCNLPIELNQGSFGVLELVFANAATGNQLISGNISGNARVVKSSTATARQTTLSGSNSFSGGLYLLNGRLNLNHNHAAGTGLITISNTTTLQLASTVAGTVITNNILLLSNANPVLFANGTGASLELAGVISGDDVSSRISRTDTGNALLILSGNNTFAGGVTISSRTLNLKHRNALGTGTFTIGDPTTAPANTINLSAGVSLTGADALPNVTTVNQNFTISGTNALELSGPITLASGTRTNTLSGAASYGKFSGAVSGDGALTKAGTGTLELSGTSSYTGDTTVSAGTLKLNGSLTASPVTISAGGTLAGTGSVTSAVSGTGTIAPGASVGSLSLAGGLDLSAGGTYSWELGTNATTPGAFDQIVLTGGELVLGGTSRLALQFVDTATSPNGGDPFWSSPHSWTIVSLAGGTNTANLGFASVIYGVYTNGTFSTSINNGEVILSWTPGTPPQPEFTSIVGAGTTNVTINFTATIVGATYQVQYKNDLAAPNWTVLGNVTGTGGPAAIVDTTDPAPPERYYRLIVL